MPAAVTLVVMRKRLGIPQAVALPVASVAPLAVAAVMPPGKGRHVAVGATYMWVFKVSWELPYDNPKKLRSRLQIDYPIRIDSLVGGGMPPTQRLQRTLRDRMEVTALDKAVTAIYGSWFVPHAVLAWILFRHEQFIPRATGRLAAAYHLTTPFYWLVPTAPPWWASESEGRMGGDVERVTRHVIRDLRGKPRLDVDATPGNPWGSMPSDHIASAAITAMALSEVSVLYGALGWTYVVLASFSVVYRGQHYVLAGIVGLAVAQRVRLGGRLVCPVVRGAAEGLERLAR